MLNLGELVSVSYFRIFSAQNQSVERGRPWIELLCPFISNPALDLSEARPKIAFGLKAVEWRADELALGSITLAVHHADIIDMGISPYVLSY